MFGQHPAPEEQVEGPPSCPGAGGSFERGRGLQEPASHRSCDSCCSVLRFGDGYMITVRTKSSSNVKDVVRFVSRNFPEAVLKVGAETPGGAVAIATSKDALCVSFRSATTPRCSSS